MASSSSSKSRWGSLLSQAVAGVEARLDTILADNEDGTATTSSKDAAAAKPTPQAPMSATPPASQKPSPGPGSRTSSTTRTNDRLQERLARAMAAKSAKEGGASPRPSVSGQPSPRGSLDVAAGRNSMESGGDAAVSQRGSQDGTGIEVEEKTGELLNGKEDGPPAKGLEEEQVNGKRESSDLPAGVESSKVEISTAQQPTRTSTESDIPIPTISEPRSSSLEITRDEDVQLAHQEEIHTYVERIDALEAKLSYLAREASSSARAEALSAPAGSLEKRLAEKDAQIAQLMEEGKTLAATEQKHRSIIKKLRGKMAEDEKELGNLRSARDKIGKEVEGLRKRARRADELERANEELRRRLLESQKELNTLRPEFNARESLVADLSKKLAGAVQQAETATARVNEAAREGDRRRIAELEESVAALAVEKNLVADRARIQVAEMREKAERASERARALELEMKAEVAGLEGKLEAMRVAAEEVSSGAGGDSQAKLLRQVETLQTQYSIASENWQGIESTLLGRIANLERERDEALGRESEMRKKAREASLRAKRNEEELEEAKTKIPSFQEDVKTYQSQLNALRKRAEQAEASLLQARTELEKQRHAWKEETAQNDRDPHDRRGGWLEDLPSAAPFRTNSRPESPLLVTPQRTFSNDLLGLDNMLPNKLRKASAPSSNSGLDRPYSSSRRPSAQPPVRPSIPMTLSHSGPSVFSPTLDTPSTTHPLDREDAFEGVETSSSSPQQVLQDMVSVSTVAAGPSVQLVERMSAAIRRLESEKVAGREELARISKQRDEARLELVGMMREVEAGKVAREKVEELERRVEEVTERYETTLELLGEKSELVEELRADVQDVKAMYRDLVERTVK